LNLIETYPILEMETIFAVSFYYNDLSCSMAIETY